MVILLSYCRFVTAYAQNVQVCIIYIYIIGLNCVAHIRETYAWCPSLRVRSSSIPTVMYCALYINPPTSLFICTSSILICDKLCQDHNNNNYCSMRVLCVCFQLNYASSTSRAVSSYTTSTIESDAHQV